MIVTLPTFLLWIIAILIPSLASMQQREAPLLCAAIYSNTKGVAWSEKEVIHTGLAVSSDRGATWSSVGWFDAHTNDFAFEPANRATIYLACENGVLKSTDAGAQWKLATPWNITAVNCIRIDPKRPEKIFAATGFGFFRSDDAGKNWKEYSDGLSTPNQTFISTIVLRPDVDDVVAATEDGLFISKSGAQWQRLALSGKSIRLLLRHPAQQNIWAAVSPRDGVFISTDNGATWETRNVGFPNTRIHAVAFDPRNENMLYASSPGYGMFMSSNQGKSWTMKSRGLTNLTVTAISVDPDDAKRIYLGTKSGSFISTDGGERWNSFTLQWTHVATMRFE